MYSSNEVRSESVNSFIRNATYMLTLPFECELQWIQIIWLQHYPSLTKTRNRLISRRTYIKQKLTFPLFHAAKGVRGLAVACEKVIRVSSHEVTIHTNQMQSHLKWNDNRHLASDKESSIFNKGDWRRICRFVEWCSATHHTAKNPAWNWFYCWAIGNVTK